jgi:hypothetical protein
MPLPDREDARYAMRNVYEIVTPLSRGFFDGRWRFFLEVTSDM